MKRDRESRCNCVWVQETTLFSVSHYLALRSDNFIWNLTIWLENSSRSELRAKHWARTSANTHTHKHIFLQNIMYTHTNTHTHTDQQRLLVSISPEGSICLRPKALRREGVKGHDTGWCCGVSVLYEEVLDSVGQKYSSKKSPSLVKILCLHARLDASYTCA